MTLKTPEEYVESLRALKIRAYVGGERVESVADHPSIAPHINTVAKTYELPPAVSPLSGAARRKSNPRPDDA